MKPEPGNSEKPGRPKLVQLFKYIGIALGIFVLIFLFSRAPFNDTASAYEATPVPAEEPANTFDPQQVIEEHLSYSFNQTPSQIAGASMDITLTNSSNEYRIKVRDVGFRTMRGLIGSQETPRTKTVDILLNPGQTITRTISWDTYNSDVTSFYPLAEGLEVEKVE